MESQKFINSRHVGIIKIGFGWLLFAMCKSQVSSHRVHKRVDKITRDFFMASSQDKRWIRLVGLELVTKPKCKGGQGIRKSKEKNSFG